MHQVQQRRVDPWRLSPVQPGDVRFLQAIEHGGDPRRALRMMAAGPMVQTGRMGVYGCGHASSIRSEPARAGSPAPSGMPCSRLPTAGTFLWIDRLSRPYHDRKGRRQGLMAVNERPAGGERNTAVRPAPGAREPGVARPLLVWAATLLCMAATPAQVVAAGAEAKAEPQAGKQGRPPADADSQPRRQTRKTGTGSGPVLQRSPRNRGERQASNRATEASRKFVAGPAHGRARAAASAPTGRMAGVHRCSWASIRSARARSRKPSR